MAALRPLAEVVEAQRRGIAAGLPSVCSAHPAVLRAVFEQASEDGSHVLVEATCNQVNAEGGYTGMTPGAFARAVRALAFAAGLPPERVSLGGDHLGPHPWRALGARDAMERGVETVRQYVRAGASKIHLDASMALAGDPPGPLAESVVAARAAELACAAEEEAAQVSSAPAYVVGTEVPPPGGHAGPDAGPTVTRAEDAERTLELVGEAFSSRGLGGALARVVALVVQPGVEFGDDVVFAYRRETAAPLARLAEARGIVFEAHSTDYQHDDALRALVADRFAILKVGPALTFAYREALFGLESIERELLAGRGEPLSGLRQALDDAMRADPRHWVGFCSGDEEAGRVQRAYGLSDRCRYYWCRPGVEEARRRLFAHLEGRRIPRGLASQFLPDALDTDGGPERLVAARVRRAFRPWARACRAGPGVAESGECP